MKNNNFLIRQYNTDQKKSLKHNYLAEQFSDYSKIFKDIEKVVKKGDYTLGDQVVKFEKNISKITGSKYALGVGNGTDALYLVLKAFNIGKGDEVITTPFTFIATTASIATAGAKPVFADVKEDYNIDENKIEKLITKKTKAIMPVHWSGRPCEMDKIRKIANKYKLKIIQDSCHAIQSKFKDRNIVEFGDACTFSMHPLKNLNVWGDGGFIITNNKTLYQELTLLRNHGLLNRNTCKVFGYNSRLDTIQATIANYKLKNKLNNITSKRIKNALFLDKLLSKNKNIKTVKRYSYLKEVFHLYQINVKERDNLQKYLIKNSIDAKVHYPTPIHLQPAAKYLKYKKGDFPIAEKLAKTSLSLPVHEFITTKDIKKIAFLINRFYS
jgi:dTDP-3-amino-2,3,6-trideoxy-4-keto-D-glucose/dTDP-3-amino-3,4,6-trideoxy-alpha-D-glucose/dTDP-2,6-dideoxy-D-kanosamine transaminase